MPALPAWRVQYVFQNSAWAVKEATLDLISAILDRHHAYRSGEGEEIDLDAIAAEYGRPLENTGHRGEIRGNTAILHVEGPIFKRADMFTKVSGATSVENLSTDLRAALDNPAVTQILLNIDSPGGQVGGMQQFTDMLYESTKPVTAYVDDEAASGAYWIASAASKIIASESSFVGSIGVAASIIDRRAAQERQGVKQYVIVSSQSPNKRPDVATDAGRAQILAMVDSLAGMFIQRVAAFRGVSTAKVRADFGQGAMLPAAVALEVGMIDGISNFEPLVARLAADSSPRAFSISVNKELPMADVTITSTAAPVPAATVTAPGTTVNSTVSQPEPVAPTLVISGKPRIATILRCPEAAGRRTLAEHLALDTDVDVDTARSILKASPVEAVSTPVNPLASAMAVVPNPKVGVGTDTDDQSPEALAASILQFVPKDRRVG